MIESFDKQDSGNCPTVGEQGLWQKLGYSEHKRMINGYVT